MKRYYLFAFALLLLVQVDAQKLVSSTFVTTTPASNFSLFPGINPTYNIASYKIQYLTSDPEGMEHTASGLLSIPLSTDHLVFPLACFQHGTVAGRDDVPSNYASGDLSLGVAFATNGYIVVEPDFVGLGDSPGIHPYVHAESEATAGIDLMLAAYEFIEGEDGISLNEQVFVSGYSQGGHAAMALQKEIETNYPDLFTITASAPMSGPYSVSDKMIDFTLGDTEYNTVSYLAWLTLGYGRAYPELLPEYNIENVFKAEFVDDINLFKDEVIDLWQLNDRMISTLTANGGQVLPKNTLQEQVLDGLLNDPDNELITALRENDTYNFVTSTPTNMYYCVGDDQVTYENAIHAEEMFLANGSTNVQAIRKDTDALPLNHTGCVFPASIDALAFFNTFKDVTSSTHETVYSDHVTVSYFDKMINVDMNEPGLDWAYLGIYDTSGRKIHTSQVPQGHSQLWLPADLPGQYIVTIYTERSLLNVTQLINH